MMSLGVILGVVGAVFVAFNKSVTANFIWSISNVLLIVRAQGLNDSESVFLFMVYEVIAIFGIIRYLFERSKRTNLEC